MGYGTGRHRRRRRGWFGRTRRAVGAVLAAVTGAGSPPPPDVARMEARTPSPRREPRKPDASRPGREPEWVRRYDEARRSRADRARTLFTEGGEGGGSGAPPELPEPGWCVDDDGVRAVRPYLVAHEQRQQSERRRAASRDSHQANPAPSTPAGTAAPNTLGEWDELTALIRQWDALRVPVA